YWILGVDQRDHRSLKAPAVVPIIPLSQMELSGMALGPQVQLLELDRSGIFTGRAGDRPGKFSENTLGKSWMIASTIALGIYLAYVPYEEEFQYFAFILVILVPVIVLAIGVDLCMKN
nr:hypothetical protein [Tanacetum cinerariifolium]